MSDDADDDYICTGVPKGMPWWEPWCGDCGACNDVCFECGCAKCRAGCAHICCEPDPEDVQ